MRVRRGATLADVAAQAGVSVTTASYVLNGRSSQMRISGQAAQRVEEAAAALSYRPNRSARNLRTASTSTIGLVTDHVASGSYSSLMLAGATAAARASRHMLVICESEGDRDLEARLVEELLERQVDSLVYATRGTAVVDVPEALREHPAVLLNCIDARAELTSIIPGELDAGRLAAATLAGAGLTTDVWIVGEDTTPESVAGPQRTQGVVEGLLETGGRVAGTVECPWDVRPAYDALSGWLAAGHRPAALVCLNDRVAFGAYQALADAGLRIPDDVSVISFDGTDLARWLRPSLASITLPFAEMGARAVELLMDPDVRVAGQVLVPMPLLPGESVRRPVAVHGGHAVPRAGGVAV